MLIRETASWRSRRNRNCILKSAHLSCHLFCRCFVYCQGSSQMSSSSYSSLYLLWVVVIVVSSGSRSKWRAWEGEMTDTIGQKYLKKVDFSNRSYEVCQQTILLPNSSPPPSPKKGMLYLQAFISGKYSEHNTVINIQAFWWHIIQIHKDRESCYQIIIYWKNLSRWLYLKVKGSNVSTLAEYSSITIYCHSPLSLPISSSN